MANFASKPVLNGLRFANNNPSTAYNTIPFEDAVDLRSYPQKWQRNDVCPIQLLFDFVPTLDIFTCDDIFVTNIPLTPTANGVLDQTFQCYEGEIDFSTLAEGFYYGKLTYEDENETLQDYRTSPLDVADNHPGTSLIQYKNSQNDKGVIFDTGIEFCLRIECNFDEFTPKAKKAQYEDQKYNGMLLNGIPYRTFVLYFGSTTTQGDSTLIPDWLVDKLNVIFTCDSVRIDGTYYIGIEGAEFKPYRVGNSYPNDGYWSLEVQDVPNYDLSKYSSGTTPEGDLIVIKQAKTYNNVAASFNVVGVFTDNMNLIRVAVWNYGLDTFIIKFGTSNGGNEIAQFTIDEDLTNSLDIGHVFNAAQTVYVTFTDLSGTVITGVNLKVIFDYNKYDAPVLNPTIGDGGKYPKGHFGYYYEVTPGDLGIHWNLATGLGQPDTKFENCAIVGTNGIEDLTGMYIQVWDKDSLATFQTHIGAVDNTIELTRAVLPDEGINLFVDQFNGNTNQKPNANQPVAITGAAGTIGYELERATGEPGIGLSGKLGDGDPLEITPSSFLLLAFVAITD